MKKVVKSFKSNTRVFDDNSIEVTPQAGGYALAEGCEEGGTLKALRHHRQEPADVRRTEMSG